MERNICNGKVFIANCYDCWRVKAQMLSMDPCLLFLWKNLRIKPILGWVSLNLAIGLYSLWCGLQSQVPKPSSHGSEVRATHRAYHHLGSQCCSLPCQLVDGLDKLWSQDTDIIEKKSNSIASSKESSYKDKLSWCFPLGKYLQCTDWESEEGL